MSGWAVGSAPAGSSVWPKDDRASAAQPYPCPAWLTDCETAPGWVTRWVLERAPLLVPGWGTGSAGSESEARGGRVQAATVRHWCAACLLALGAPAVSDPPTRVGTSVGTVLGAVVGGREGAPVGAVGAFSQPDVIAEKHG